MVTTAMASCLLDSVVAPYRLVGALTPWGNRAPDIRDRMRHCPVKRACEVGPTCRTAVRESTPGGRGAPNPAGRLGTGAPRPQDRAIGRRSAPGTPTLLACRNPVDPGACAAREHFWS